MVKSKSDLMTMRKSCILIDTKAKSEKILWASSNSLQLIPSITFSFFTMSMLRTIAGAPLSGNYVTPDIAIIEAQVKSSCLLFNECLFLWPTRNKDTEITQPQFINYMPNCPRCQYENVFFGVCVVEAKKCVIKCLLRELHGYFIIS